MTGELTSRSNQGTAFSIMNVSYRLGQIIGLPLGGLLAHPERRWNTFDTPFWREYPFLLPCLVGASFAIISVGFGIVFVEEVSPQRCASSPKLTSQRPFHPKSKLGAQPSERPTTASRLPLLRSPHKLQPPHKAQPPHMTRPPLSSEIPSSVPTSKYNRPHGEQS
jgi:MFS family permease